MSKKIFLPHSGQFDEMNRHLESIAKAIGSQVDISTWAGIQRAVRVGIAPNIFPIGTQLLVHHNVYGDQMYDVVAHDYFKSVHDENAHTMTLMAHNQISATQFDSQEAFYDNGALAAGTYGFTLDTNYLQWEAGTYWFNLAKPLPANGQLCISGTANNAMNSCTISSYESRTSTTPIESNIIINVGNAGTNLGSFGGNLNHAHRVSFGSNNYGESAIRQFLNSSSMAGGVWTPKITFDRPPTWANTLAGFAGGFDDDFLSVVGEVIVPCSNNNTYEAPPYYTDGRIGEKYTVTDKFYLASQREIFGAGVDTVDDGSILFPYYDGATNTDRIKYRDGTVAGWWTRSCYPWFASSVQVVTSEGTSYNHGASSTTGCVPVCTIV